MAKWSHAFPNVPITNAQIATYCEALDNIGPLDLENACREATRTAEQFPKPGHIRNALLRLQDTPRNRPDYLDEPILPAAERWGPEEQAASDKLRLKLGMPVKVR